MKKLKSKVFWVIFIILTAFSVGIITITNVQDYRQEYHEIVSRFVRVENFKNEPEKKDDNTPPPDNAMLDNKIRFADAVVYTVLLDDNNNVKSVINHSNDEISTDEIKAIATDFLKSSNKKTQVGNLFFTEYSFSIRNNTMTITDNSQTNSKLQRQLVISLFTLLLIEALAVVISKKLTSWIIKPVEESFEKQKQFIADASHELKTPLSVIMASSDALESDMSEVKWLDNIKSESERMNKLITSLLDLAKSEEYDEALTLENLNLSKLVETSALSFEGVMFEKGLTLDYDIEKDVYIEGDSDKIKQLVAILVDNAIHHADKNTTVFISLHKQGKAVLTVQNCGQPIPSGEEEKIFERFYRSDKSRNRNDNRYGLGLAIAKNIVLSLKAEISAKSFDGKTIFKVTF